MDVWMIWATEGGFHWLVEAWDDETTAENNSGWQEAKKKAYDAYGPENVRITKHTVDFEAVVKSFEPTVI